MLRSKIGIFAYHTPTSFSNLIVAKPKSGFCSKITLASFRVKWRIVVFGFKPPYLRQYLIFISTWTFRSKPLLETQLCLWKTTKTFIFLKCIFIPVLKLPYLAVKAFMCLFFYKNLCAFFKFKGFMCLIVHALLKN